MTSVMTDYIHVSDGGEVSFIPGEMTDNRTIELRRLLDERGVEYTANDHMGAYATSWNGFTAMQLTPSAKLMMAFTPEQAIAATLGSRTCENVAREWEKTSFAHACTSFCCSECGAHYVDAECYYAGLADKDEEQIRTSFCPNCGSKVVGE